MNNIPFSICSVDFASLLGVDSLHRARTTSVKVHSLVLFGGHQTRHRLQSAPAASPHPCAAATWCWPPAAGPGRWPRRSLGQCASGRRLLRRPRRSIAAAGVDAGRALRRCREKPMRPAPGPARLRGQLSAGRLRRRAAEVCSWSQMTSGRQNAASCSVRVSGYGWPSDD